ncbi:hypothetical protein DXA89_07755 [Weissella cibaria]|nr:hypothetical protein DXA89_07755 [Weissella cibaria]
MYYLVNKQATTLTFYFEDGTQDFGLEQLFNLSRTAFAETIAPYGIGDHIEEAMASNKLFRLTSARIWRLRLRMN